MIDKITHLIVLVKDQGEALEFYTKKLGFEKRFDETLENRFRWLVVSPPGQKETGLVLFKAETEEEQKAVGTQTGGRLSLLVVSTADCQKTYAEMRAKGVEFLGAPMNNPWGIGVQFKDLYGNKFDLVQPRGLA